MALHLSPAYNVYDDMKSWSLGRKAGKKDRKSKSPESSPTRPKSLIMNMPSASSGAELASSVQASPSLTFSTSPHSRQSSIENELSSSPSASKYLSTTQLKDKVRRLKTTSTSTSSSRPPLTAKNNNHDGGTDGDATRVRKASLPSLIKSPIAAQPTPSAPLVSPAAAVVGGRQSTDSHENNPFSDVSSLESSNHPPSPSPAPRQDTLAPLLSSQANHTCDTHQEDQPPKSKASEAITRTKASEVTPKAEEATHYPSTVASLRRFKGVEGFGSLDKVKHAHFDSLTVRESEDKEAASTQSNTATTTTSTTSKEQPKYSFAIRKSRSGPAPKGQQKALTRRGSPRKIEAKYDVAIETQRVLSWTFNQGRAGTVLVRQRRIIAIPIPSLFGADQAASWTVERISRLTSCLIHAFGS